MNLKDRLTPKNIILEAIRSKLEPQGINKLVAIFNVETDKYNVMLSKEGCNNMNIEIEENDINMIKKMFISKITKKFEEDSNKEIKNIIIELDLKNNEFKVFIEELKSGEVVKIDY